jgi:A/G-specific adenine glycosylase
VGKPSTKHPSRPRPNAGVKLLAWYDKNRRILPWRAAPGERADPYRVWLSEIMLQQTTVAAVAPYYARFLARWPTVGSLAAASLDDVLAAWAGLGYYARARNLHRAARVVALDMGGRFPRDATELRALPGVGDYTAGAIAAIAFDAPEVAVDANAERVLARLFAVGESLPKSKPRLRELARSILPAKRAGDFAQALMDLGALVCAKVPDCDRCPLARDCRGYALGIAQMLPRKAEKRAKPLRRGAAFVACDRKGAVLLERRPENGLLGGMVQPPMTAWGDVFPTFEDAVRQAPFAAEWMKHVGVVRHSFTHFDLELEVYRAVVARKPAANGQWVPAEHIAGSALPTVMRKILKHAYV